MEEILEKLGPNHTDTIGFTRIQERTKVYALYTLNNRVYVLKDGKDITFEEITESEQIEILNHFKLGLYKIDNTIQ